MVHVINDVQTVLGTFVTITVVHPDVDEGISALHAAFHASPPLNSMIKL
jgi:hypothetical protein